MKLPIPLLHIWGAPELDERRGRAVWRGALLSAVTMFNGYYDLPLRVTLLKITDSVSHITQRVTSIDDGQNFPCFKEIFQKNQILLV